MGVAVLCCCTGPDVPIVTAGFSERSVSISSPSERPGAGEDVDRRERRRVATIPSRWMIARTPCEAAQLPPASSLRASGQRSIRAAHSRPM
jgi:hypothetical protein